MNTYRKLEGHLEKYVYKRGQFKGDAPALRSSRGMTSFRVQKLEDCMAVKLWNTHIIKAYPDGRMVLNTEGWFDRQTTKDKLSRALALFCNWGWGDTPRNISKFGHRQSTMRLNGKTIRYYDGIELMETVEGVWKVTSPPIPFSTRCINKKQSKEFAKAVTDSGFRSMFKVLHGSCPLERGRYVNTTATNLEKLITDANYANSWMELIQYLSIQNGWFRDSSGGIYKQGNRKKDAKSVWGYITRTVKSDMYDVLPTDIYEV
jgi:hypothetical protein